MLKQWGPDDLGVIAEVIASESFISKFEANDTETYESQIPSSIS